MKYGIISFFFFLATGNSLVAMDQQTLPTETDDLVKLLISDSESIMFQGGSQDSMAEEKPDALPVFLQQLCYHDRLIVNLSTEEVAQDAGMEPARLKALNKCASQLLAVAGKRARSNQSSGWVFKAERYSYILHPLHLAIKYGIEPAVKTLLTAGADPNVQDHLGRKPLHMLMTLGDPDIQFKLVSLLLFYNTSIDTPNKQGNTLLTLAAEQGAHGLVEYLLDRNADPNIHVEAEFKAQGLGERNTYACGTSPLWAAAQQGREEIVALLLKKHARVKPSERQFARLMYDTCGSEAQKILLGSVLLTHR